MIVSFAMSSRLREPVRHDLGEVLMTVLTSLVVKVRTSSTAGSDTDDNIYFGIGPREWLLDNKGRNDFEKGRIDTFVLGNLAGLVDADIRRIRLRKYGTDGWKPNWIKVYVNDPNTTRRPFYEERIDFFLDGGRGAEQKAGLGWEASTFPPRFSIPSDNVTKLIVEVTTGSIANAGTDDEVYFSIGTREWHLNNLSRDDFEPGRTDTFILENLSGLRLTDIKQIGLRKTGTDGWYPSRIRVWINAAPPAAVFFTDTIDMWLDGGSGAEQKSGLVWNSRNYPQPSPQPVENKVTSLRVVLATDDADYAGTDDEVYFSIGTREWLLDNVGRNDFEPAKTDTFDLGDLSAMGGLRISDIRKIALRKNGTDGWRPKRITVFVNGTSKAFYVGTIDTWLDGGKGAENNFGLTWEARDFAYEIPVYGHRVVGQDDASVGPTRSQQASAELLTNLNTADYRTQAGSSDAYWSQGAITYRVVGFDTVTVTDADALVMPDSDSADRTAMADVARANNKPDRLNIYFVRQTETGSNWHIDRGTGSAACWVKDTRNGATVGTTNNFRMVAISTSHEIGHYFDLPHRGVKKFLMTGTGTNATSQLLTKAEVKTARSDAKNLAE